METSNKLNQLSYASMMANLIRSSIGSQQMHRMDHSSQDLLISNRSQPNLMSPAHHSLLSLHSGKAAQSIHQTLLQSLSSARNMPDTVTPTVTFPRKPFVESSAHQKLGALIQAYKTRRILKSHNVVSKLKTDYSDLLSFAFGL